MIDIILSFYLMLSIPSLQTLLPKKYIEFVSSNRMIQHLIAFMAMIFIIHHLHKEIELYDSIKYAIGLYCLFLLTTKMDLQITIIALLLLTVCYFYESSLNAKIEQLTNDKAISMDKKDELILEQQKNKAYMYVAVVLLLIGGSYVYCEKKRIQYGGGFDLDKYIFG
jgi:hypothetical protein